MAKFEMFNSSASMPASHLDPDLTSGADLADGPGKNSSDHSGSAPGSSSVGEDRKNVLSDSVKVMAESIGIAGLSDDAARELAEDATFRLRSLVQNAQKFMVHSKRRQLFCEDLDMALKTEGQEPLYGSVASEHLPFRYASGGGRDVHFHEDKELDLIEQTVVPLKKIPLDVSLRAHWLAIDGEQPSIPENPPVLSKQQLKAEAADPLSKLKKADAKENKVALAHQAIKLKTIETVSVKQLAKHELSVEQQLYYKEITEACVGSDESRRAEALQSLASDPGLHQMLPRLCTFIAEGVRVNVVQHNLAFLIYLMRMVKSLLENQTLLLEKYLHELIPAVTTCIVAKQLCTRPDVDNHWALRDFASRLLGNICKNFNSSTNNIQTRVTRMFCEALRNDRSPLVSYYGAVAGLQELGFEVIKSCIIPHVRAISVRLDQINDNAAIGAADKIASTHIRNLLIKSVCPVLKTFRQPPDMVEEYKQDFGSMGAYLHAGVQRSRQNSASAKAASTVTASTAVLSSVGQLPGQRQPLAPASQEV